METSAVLLERPPIRPEAGTSSDLYAELGELALAISEEFATPSIFDEGVLKTERYVTQPVETVDAYTRHVLRNNPDYQRSAMSYFNLRLKAANSSWQFDFTAFANPDEDTLTERGNTPTGQFERNEEGLLSEDRPWMDGQTIRELDVNEAELILWGLQSLHQSLIEQNLQ